LQQKRFPVEKRKGQRPLERWPWHAASLSLGRDFPDDAIIIVSAVDRGSEEIAVAIETHAAYGIATIGTVGEVMQVGVGPASASRRTLYR
jgi:hypothetical protein